MNTSTESVLFDLGGVSPMLWDDDSPRARRTDPIESHEAADSNTNRREVMEAVLMILRDVGPMTDEELTVFYQSHAHILPTAHADSPRKRRSDLVKAGLVRATAERRPISTGRSARVWEAC